MIFASPSERTLFLFLGEALTIDEDSVGAFWPWATYAAIGYERFLLHSRSPQLQFSLEARTLSIAPLASPWSHSLVSFLEFDRSVRTFRSKWQSLPRNISYSQIRSISNLCFVFSVLFVHVSLHRWVYFQAFLVSLHLVWRHVEDSCFCFNMFFWTYFAFTRYRIWERLYILITSQIYI